LRLRQLKRQKLKLQEQIESLRPSERRQAPRPIDPVRP
jgi:hypothetical protein